MKRTRHTPEQIVSKLREAAAMLAAGRTPAQVLQHLGVSEATYHRWQSQYGGMKADEAEARALAAAWRHEYNHHRPHSSLGYIPPAYPHPTLIDPGTRFGGSLALQR